VTKNNLQPPITYADDVSLTRIAKNNKQSVA